MQANREQSIELAGWRGQAVAEHRYVLLLALRAAGSRGRFSSRIIWCRLVRAGARSASSPKFPPSRLVNAFDQVVEPLITEIT